MPWNTVIKASSNDVEFWEKELKEPALLFTFGQGKSRPSFIHAPLEGDDDDGPQGGNKMRGNRGGRGKKRPGGQDQVEQPRKQPKGGRQGPKGSSKGGKGSAKRSASGRHLVDRNGTQVCYNWNRALGGCSSGQCPNGRSHVCEHCLQPHRGVDCPKKTSSGSGGNATHT